MTALVTTILMKTKKTHSKFPHNSHNKKIPLLTPATAPVLKPCWRHQSQKIQIKKKKKISPEIETEENWQSITPSNKLFETPLFEQPVGRFSKVTLSFSSKNCFDLLNQTDDIDPSESFSTPQEISNSRLLTITETIPFSPFPIDTSPPIPKNSETNQPSNNLKENKTEIEEITSTDGCITTSDDETDEENDNIGDTSINSDTSIISESKTVTPTKPKRTKKQPDRLTYKPEQKKKQNIGKNNKNKKYNQTKTIKQTQKQKKKKKKLNSNPSNSFTNK